MNENKTSQRGFTRTDALAAMTGVVITATLASSAARATQASAGLAACLGNQGKLALAWGLYAEDHDGALVASYRNYIKLGQPFVPEWSGLTGGDESTRGGGTSPGWLDLPITQVGSINAALSVNTSPLSPYLENNPTRWRCPGDESRGARPEYRGGQEYPRVRSYSMNGWLGPDSGWGDFRNYSRPFRMSEIEVLSPSSTFVTIGEHPSSINDGFFIVDMQGQANPRSTRIVDYPASNHEGAAALSYADGHVEARRWVDERTTPSVAFGTELSLNVSSPLNSDINWLQARSTVLIDQN